MISLSLFFFDALYIVNLSDFVSSSQVLFTLQYNVNHHDMKKSSIFFKFLPHQLQISKKNYFILYHKCKLRDIFPLLQTRNGKKSP